MATGRSATSFSCGLVHTPPRCSPNSWAGLFGATVLIGGLASAVIGLAVVFPLLRTKGFGFFIGSFALGEFIRLIWVKFHFPFGGPRGMIGIDTIELGDIDFYSATPYYYVCLIFTMICLYVLYRIDQSRMGKVLKAIYADEDLAKSIGVNVSRYRAMSFSISAFFAGIGGVLLAHRLGAVDPKLFGRQHHGLSGDLGRCRRSCDLLGADRRRISDVDHLRILAAAR